MSKVAILLASLSGYGVQRVAMNLASGFIEHGLEVDIVVAHAAGPFTKQIPSGARVVDLGATRILSSLPALVSYLSHERPEVLLSCADPMNPVAIWAKLMSLGRTRVVISTHTNLDACARHQTYARRRYRAIPILLRFLWRFADGIVAVSHGTADELSRLVHIPRERITVIYSPFPVAKILEMSREELPATQAWPSDAPVVLAAGSLTTAKDYPNLLTAFARLRSGRDARLVILGEGELHRELTQLAASLDIAEDMSIWAFDLNPYRYMARCGVFVLSSAWEGFGNVLVEALACGSQVVATDCPNGPAEILDGGKYGRLVPVGNPDALATAMEAALDYPLRREELLARAHAFGFENSVDRYMQVLGVK